MTLGRMNSCKPLPSDHRPLRQWGLLIPRQPTWVMLAAALLLSGCSPADRIADYTVPKPQFVERGEAAKQLSPPAKAAEQPARMLGLILPQGPAMWFGKLTGPPEAIADIKPAFVEWVNSWKFPREDQPTWTLPSGWTQAPGSGMRFATLSIPTNKGPALDVSVMSLPSATDQPQGPQLAANINRWRGQLGLPPESEQQVTAGAQQLTVGGVTAYLVDLTGQQSADSGMGGMNRPGPPGAGAPAGSRAAGPLPGGGPVAGPANGRPPAADASPREDFSATPPAEWKPGRVSSLRRAAYLVTDADRKAEVTVISLEGITQSVGDNVNRWRQEIGMEPLPTDAAAASTEEITIGGRPGRIVQLLGNPDKEPGEATLAAMVVEPTASWFFKLRGDRQLVQREHPKFLKYLETVKFGADAATAPQP